MELQAVDGSKLLVLMIAGAVIAAAGLYLMLKPKPEDSAKIEIFGLKFESSSAGLLVFVIGAAFLAVPLFAPERPSSVAFSDAPDARNGASVPADEQSGGTGSELATPPAPNVVAVAPAQLQSTRAEEEPNDVIRTSNALVLGQTITGVTRNNEPDWFRLDISQATENAELRLRRNGSDVYEYVLLNGREQELSSAWVRDSTIFVELEPDQSKVYFLLLRTSAGGGAQYEVSIYEIDGN